MSSKLNDSPHVQAGSVPVVRYAARSKVGEDVHESTKSQVAQIDAALARLDGRTLVGEPHIDYASGSKSNRGPGLAAAIHEAIAAADDHGSAELWVFHSSRLGRGSGKKGGARALGRLLYELQANGVAVRSVSDDEFTTNEMLWGFASRQASKYSEDLSDHITRGYQEAAARGTAAWLARGIQTAGYQVLREFDERGRVQHTAIKHGEDAWIFETIFRMAKAGHSAQAIQLELSSRGARTRPMRKDHTARPYDVGRIKQILENPIYAGLLAHKGKIVGPGQWPRFIAPEEFFQLRAERAARGHSSPVRKAGRPPVGYLLAGRVTCGECGGPCRVQTDRKRRPDGSPLRRYVCTAHRNHHKDSAEWCPALPYDAEPADKTVLAGIDSLLGDADSLRAQLDAGRVAEVERMGQVVTAAREDTEKAERVAAKALERYEQALEEGDEEAAEIALSVVRRKREEVSRADKRLNAALDALNAQPARNDGDVLARVWEALSGRVKDAEGDVRKLNIALREWFERFELFRTADGLRIVPVLSVEALQQVIRDPERFPHYGITPMDDTGTAFVIESEILSRLRR